MVPYVRVVQVSVSRHKVIYSLLDEVRDTLQQAMPFERVEAPVGKVSHRPAPE
jgi:hypothetical protein